MLSLISLIKEFLSSPLRTLTNMVTYLKQGMLLFQLFLSILNTTILLRVGAISELPFYVIFLLIVLFLAPCVVLLGYFDYKKGTYQSTIVITTKNSPPSRDMYSAVDILLSQLDQNDQVLSVRERIKRWY